MGMHDLTENLVHVRQDVDMKGHVFATSEDGSYVFCSRCFTSRKSRDRKWILLHPCAHPDRPARNLWEEYTIDVHLGSAASEEMETLWMETLPQMSLL